MFFRLIIFILVIMCEKICILITGEISKRNIFLVYITNIVIRVFIGKWIIIIMSFNIKFSVELWRLKVI